LEMRKELGNPKTDLEPKDLLRFIITDPDNIKF